VEHARLARSRRPDQGEQPGSGPESLDQLGDQRLATEEVARVASSNDRRLLVRVVRRSRRRARRLRSERRVADQDALLEPLQGGTRLDRELLGEDRPVRLVRAERLGTPAGPVQGQDVDLARTLADRVRGDGGLDRLERRLGAPARDLRGGQLLLGSNVDPVEVPDVVLCELLVDELGQRRPVPELEGCAEVTCCRRGVARFRVAGASATRLPRTAGRRSTPGRPRERNRAAGS
jgi:hypothetical protein